MSEHLDASAGIDPDPSTPGLITAAPFDVFMDRSSNHPTQELTTQAPFEIDISRDLPGYVAPRYLIKEMPTTQEFDEGSSFIGENGEFKDAARLLQAVERYDPEHKLADPKYRTELIQHASVADFKHAILAINRELYPTSEESSNLADNEVTLSSGTGDEKHVGFIGIAPDDVDEVLETILDGMKDFAAKGDLHKAGLLAANTLVPLQMMKDGNKRTARAIYELVAFGYDGFTSDQVAMRRRLAFTQEARNSFYYASTDTRIKTAFQQERLPENLRAPFETFNGRWHDASKRPKLNEALISIKDPALKEATINVLQQYGFGARYVFESANHELMKKYAEPIDSAQRAKIMEQVITELGQSMDDSRAAELIQIDRKQRKEFVQRLVTSTTGKHKLSSFFGADGKPKGKYYANIAA